MNSEETSGLNAAILEGRMKLPLDKKIEISKSRIKQWYEHYEGKVYVAFSGGKDSTVLLHIVRSIYPDVPAVFCNTGLEFPEIVAFTKKIPNVITIRPTLSFKQIIDKYGYPVGSKKIAAQIHKLRHPTKNNFHTRQLYLTGINSEGVYRWMWRLSKKWYKLIDAPFETSNKCCDFLKHQPSYKYEMETGNKPFVGTLATDSLLRKAIYLKEGCNNFGSTHPRSVPLSFWRTNDIWEYIKSRKVDYCEIYDMGYTATGCIYCMFGVHLEKAPNRFQLLNKTHPKLHNYCINNLGLGKVLDYIGVDYYDGNLSSYFSDKKGD